MNRKTFDEYLLAAFARDGCKPIKIGYTPPRRKRKAAAAKRSKRSVNGKARSHR